jgi:hypothetical protein
MSEIVTLTITKELKDEIDSIRGDIPRSKFIVRLLEKTLPGTPKQVLFNDGQITSQI